MLSIQPWFIALSLFIQLWLTRVRHARSTHQNRHRLWVLKRKGDFQLAVFPWGKVAWEWNKQQLKVLSLLRLAFHTWPFLGRVSLVPRPYSLGTRLWRSSHARLQALVGFSPENVIHLKCILPSRYDPLSNNQTSVYAWHHPKKVYYHKVKCLYMFC